MLDRQFVLIALTLAGVCVVIVGTLRAWARLRSAQMLRARSDESFTTFFASIARAQIGEQVARVVYDAFLPESRCLEPWPVRATDRLWKERGVDYPEELAEFLTPVLQRLGHSVVITPVEVDALRTVGDVTVWVQERVGVRPT